MTEDAFDLGVPAFQKESPFSVVERMAVAVDPVVAHDASDSERRPML
jgi:hypothetical protein